MRNGTGEPVRCFQKRSIRKYTAKAFKFTDKNLQPGLKKKKEKNHYQERINWRLTAQFFADSGCVDKFTCRSRYTLCDKGTSFLPRLNFHQGISIWCREPKQKFKFLNHFEIGTNCCQDIEQQGKPCKRTILNASCSIYDCYWSSYWMCFIGNWSIPEIKLTIFRNEWNFYSLFLPHSHVCLCV